MPVYQPVGDPNYLGFLSTGMFNPPDLIGAEAKAYDVASHIQQMQKTAIEISKAKEMQPFLLADAELSNKLKQMEVKAAEITYSPERLAAAADLKMQQERFQIEDMKRKRDANNAVDAFNTKYAPDMMKAMANNNMDDFASVWSKAASDPESRYMIPEMMEFRKQMTSQQNADIDANLKKMEYEFKLQSIALPDMTQKANVELAKIDKKKAELATAKVMAQDYGFGGDVTGTKEGRDAKLRDLVKGTFSQLKDVLDTPTNKDNPDLAAYRILADIDDIKKPIKISPYMSAMPVDMSFMEAPLQRADEIRSTILQFAKNLDSKDVEVAKAAATGLQNYLAAFPGAARDRFAQDEAKIDAEKQAAVAGLNEHIRTLMANMEGLVSPHDRAKMAHDIELAKIRRAQLAGYTTTRKNETTGEVITTTRTPSGGVSAMSGGQMVRMIGPSGDTGSIPADKVDAAIAAGYRRE